MRLREQNPPIFTPKPPPTILPFDSIERYIFLRTKKIVLSVIKKRWVMFYILFHHIFNYPIQLFTKNHGSRRKISAFDRY